MNAAGALAGSRSGTKVQPINAGSSSSEMARDGRKKRAARERRKTVLKGLKDFEESSPPMKTTRAKFRICCESPQSSKGATIFHTCFGLIILMSLVFMTGETLNHDAVLFPGNLKPHEYKFAEIIFTVMFSIDLLFRMAIADRFFIKRRYPEHLESHLPFFRDLLNWFDFLSILPLPIDILVTSMFQGSAVPKYIRLLSVFRVLRIFKVTRHFEGTKIIIKTAQSSAAPILVSCFMLLSFMFVVSPILFFVEPCHVKEECVFDDAFNSMYYLMITLTTVGYGDQIPASAPGKTVGVVMMLSGALYMAMPLAIIGTKFDEAYQKFETNKTMQDPAWAKRQMAKLQKVTRTARRKRALNFGYQIAEEVGELIGWEERWQELRGLEGGSEEEERKSKHQLLGALFEDSGSLAIDLNVLFGLNYQETVHASSGRDTATKETADGVTLGGAFWNSSDPFSKKKGKLSDEENLALELIDKGKKEILALRTLNRNYLDEVEHAVASDKCRDKLWVCMEIPKSSKCSFFFHWFALIMTLLSILLFLVETMPDFNEYRESGRVCREVVKHHCDKIYNKYVDAPKELKQEAFLANVGCFSSEFQLKELNISYPTYREQKKINDTMSELKIGNYKGCWKKGGFKTSELDEYCHWPAPELGFSCDSKLRWNQLTDGDNKKPLRNEKDNKIHGTKIYHATKWQNPFNSHWLTRTGPKESKRGVEKDNEWLAAHANQYGSSTDIEIDICHREQCISNGATDWAGFFMIGEVMFATWFCIELTLRICAARSYRVYFRTVSNLFDIFAVFISVGEAVYLPFLLGSPLYEVWGNPWGDPATMRAFRLLVTIRFITMQRHFSGLKVIKLTVKKVAGKMKIPIFFFFVFAVVFASFFYIIESGDLFLDCKVGDYNPPTMNEHVEICAGNDKSDGKRMECVIEMNNNIGVCRACPVYQHSLSDNTKYEELFQYNGTCKNFIIISGENGPRLEEPKIIDMLDAIWTMIVTMTTVGYGGFYPLQPAGKITALVAALFGSFYMAMPLTIVGSKFYEIYQDVEDEELMMAEDLKKIFDKEQHKRKKLVEVDMNLTVAQLSRFKLKASAAKDRVREMGLHPDEIEQAFNYIKSVDELPGNHDGDALKKFMACHFGMIRLMSKHLVHRKNTSVQHS